MTEKLPPRSKVQITLGVASNILKKVPRIAFFSLAFLAIFWVGQQLYYGLMPGQHFLNYYYAKVDDTPVGTDPLAGAAPGANGLPSPSAASKVAEGTKNSVPVTAVLKSSRRS